MLGTDENIVAPKSREEHIKNFILIVQEAENQMALFRDSIKETKVSYIENSWLQKEEIQLAMKAYKALKGNLDLGDVLEYAELIRDVVV